jgi:predicted dehydrogenase
MMKNTRRSFLKLAGLSGIGLAGSLQLPGCSSASRMKGRSKADELLIQSRKGHNQQFNMSGYGAPKLERVRIGFIGLGNRGPVHVGNMSKLEGVEVVALCDLRNEKAEAAKKRIAGSKHNPTVYSGGTEEWKKLCDRNDIDLVVIATPWHLHTPIALYAMNQGKHACVEVPAATNLEECWQLVETSERTRKHCMMLENTCYDFFELLTLNMARQGFFGEIIHGEGAYIHDLLEGNFSKTKYWDLWRLKQNATRKGCLYPTHGLGPVCQVMNINRGDKLDYLVSVTGNDFMMHDMAVQLAATDDFYKPFTASSFRGNMNTTTMRTNKGRTIMIQHDVTSPRPYSRIHLISGTKGTAMKYPEPGRISTGHQGWFSEKQMQSLEAQYTPAIVRKIGEMAKEIGGHGGMDFLMQWRVVDCLRNGLPLDQDVYDAALWSSIFPLSEWSVNNRSNSIDVPDFTGGSWKVNQPVDLLLSKGANTKVII